MLGNWIEQTTTTTGTGNLTVASISNRKTIHGEFGTGGRFNYSIRDDSGNPLEAGIGHMSDSTTLVRDWVYEINTSGTFSKPQSASGQLSLASGTKTVAVSALAQHIGIGQFSSFAAQNTTANNRLILPDNVILAEASTISLTQNRLYAFPAYFSYPIKADAFGFRPGATTNADIALYHLNRDGLPGALAISTTGTAFAGGMGFATFTAQWISPGWYALAVNCSAAISAYRFTLREGYGRTDVSTQVAALFLTRTQGTLPDPFGTPSTIGNLATVPGIALRHT